MAASSGGGGGVATSSGGGAVKSTTSFNGVPVIVEGRGRRSDDRCIEAARAAW